VHGKAVRAPKISRPLSRVMSLFFRRLFSSEIRRETVNGARVYHIPGANEPYPSVTTVLSIINRTQLNEWEKREAVESAIRALTSAGVERLTDPAFVKTVVSNALSAPTAIGRRASVAGTSAHDRLDNILLMTSEQRQEFMKTVTDPSDAAVLGGFLTWEKDCGVKLIQQDTFVYSHTHKFAGAMDAVGLTHAGALVALDWKTSNRLYSSNALQVAAYSIAWNEMFPQRQITEAFVVRFAKDVPQYESARVASLHECQTAFLAALCLWRSNRKKLLQTGR
jgi:hypothetical protein